MVISRIQNPFSPIFCSVYEQKYFGALLTHNNDAHRKVRAQRIRCRRKYGEDCRSLDRPLDVAEQLPPRGKNKRV